MTEATYSDAKMKLRQEVLAILLKKYGHEGNNKAIYECADEWITRGNHMTAGLIDFFKLYYD